MTFSLKRVLWGPASTFLERKEMFLKHDFTLWNMNEITRSLIIITQSKTFFLKFTVGRLINQTSCPPASGLNFISNSYRLPLDQRELVLVNLCCNATTQLLMSRRLMQTFDVVLATILLWQNFTTIGWQHYLFTKEQNRFHHDSATAFTINSINK